MNSKKEVPWILTVRLACPDLSLRVEFKHHVKTLVFFPVHTSLLAQCKILLQGCMAVCYQF